jgi:glycine cleavage system H lipoate-binding protein
MPEFLEVTVDKFTFKVATDRFYTREGLWVLPVADRVRVGLSDFLQQRSGDIAFAEIKPVGTALPIGERAPRSKPSR